MIELNKLNGASKYAHEVSARLLSEFDEHLYGAEFGVAYGGGLLRMGRDWQGRGTVYGFDTFEGHPKEIAAQCSDAIADGGEKSHAATCMDYWYHLGKDDKEYSTDNLTMGSIQKRLDESGVNNVVLCKGLITEETNLWFIPKLHYVLLDLDFVLSMKNAFDIVNDKIVKGGYLCLHDVVPDGHIKGLHQWYQTIEGYEKVADLYHCYLSILKKK